MPNETDFITFLRAVFVQAGASEVEMSPTVEVKGLRNFIGDMAIETNGSRHMVEVKFFRSVRLPTAIFKKILDRLSEIRLPPQFDRTVLVIDRAATQGMRKLASQANIILIDQSDLLRLCGDNEFLLQSYRVFFGSTESSDLSATDPNEITFFAGRTRRIQRSPQERGSALIDQLTNLKSGRPSSAQYERLVMEIIDFCFEKAFVTRRPQRTSSSAIHRYDLICGVRRTQPGFFRDLLEDFRSRYIIFEFKNYSKKITQHQIYTTEKYLLPVAMRGTAIIISRNGATVNARRVMAGALREAGKLILCLDDLQLIEMIEEAAGITNVAAASYDLKAPGEPGDILYRALDELLETLER